MKFKDYLTENTSTMTFWHGGNLETSREELKSQKKGRWEYGPGIYLTTHYDTAIKYAKGSRKLYQLTIEKGTNISDINIPFERINEFIKHFVIIKKRNLVLERLKRYTENDSINADIFLNIIINNDAIKNINTEELREFLVSNGIDYSVVRNAFGWHEIMLVLFNKEKIKHLKRITPTDKIEQFDLPTEWS